MNRQEYLEQCRIKREKNSKKREEYLKKWRLENKTRINQLQKDWYQKNKQHHLEKGREWQKSHRKEAVIIVQRYNKKHPEKLKSYNKLYNISIDGKYRLLRHRHEKLWDSPVITKNEFIEISSKSCEYCGGKDTNRGIDRIDNGKGYTLENSASCCKMCNYMKNKFNVDDFLYHIEKIYKFIFKG